MVFAMTLRSLRSNPRGVTSRRSLGRDSRHARLYRSRRANWSLDVRLRRIRRSKTVGKLTISVANLDTVRWSAIDMKNIELCSRISACFLIRCDRSGSRFSTTVRRRSSAVFDGSGARRASWKYLVVRSASPLPWVSCDRWPGFHRAGRWPRVDHRCVHAADHGAARVHRCSSRRSTCTGATGSVGWSTRARPTRSSRRRASRCSDPGRFAVAGRVRPRARRSTLARRLRPRSVSRRTRLSSSNPRACDVFARILHGGIAAFERRRRLGPRRVRARVRTGAAVDATTLARVRVPSHHVVRAVRSSLRAGGFAFCSRSLEP